jgi:hypothetical protein
MVGVQAAKRMIDSQADLAGVDIEATTLVDTDSDGDTFRVLETDADTEAEQVGFQITHPGGPMGDRMFKDRLKQYFDALREQQRSDDRDTSADTTETDDTDTDDAADASESDTPTDDHSARIAETSATDPPPSHDVSADTTTPLVDTSIDVAITDDSINALRAELDDVTDPETVVELEARIDSLEDRVETLEAAFDALASVGQRPDQE